MKRLALTVSVLLGLTLQAPIASAGVVIHKPETKTLHYSGDVVRGDSKKLQKALKDHPDTKRITLSSKGGDAIEGFRLGYTIKDKGLTVEVPKGTLCLSACAIAFMAGDTKIINGVLGFHVAWLDKKLESNEALKNGQLLGSITGIYFYNTGYIAQLQYLIGALTNKDTFLLMYSEEDLAMFEIKEGVDFSEILEIPDDWFLERIAGPVRMHFLSKTIEKGG